MWLFLLAIVLCELIFRKEFRRMNNIFNLGEFLNDIESTAFPIEVAERIFLLKVKDY